ncbi:Mediator complex subunit Med10 [Gracilaria domingensis]|nr:Mediator complex subunit Med10 [Gracilaria domingensis]
MCTSTHGCEFTFWLPTELSRRETRSSPRMDDDSDVILVETRPAQPVAEPSASGATPLDALEIELQSTCAVLTSFAQDVIQFSYDSQNGLFDRVNEFVTCLKKVDEKGKAVDAVIPFDVLEAIDKGRNPEYVTLALLYVALLCFCLRESCQEANNVSRGKVSVMRQFKYVMYQRISQMVRLVVLSVSSNLAALRLCRQNLENAMRDLPQQTAQPNGIDAERSTNPG